MNDIDDLLNFIKSNKNNKDCHINIEPENIQAYSAQDGLSNPKDAINRDMVLNVFADTWLYKNIQHQLH